MSGSDQLADALSQLDSNGRAFLEAWEASTPAWKDIQRDRMEQHNVVPLVEAIASYRSQLIDSTQQAVSAIQTL